MRVENPALKLLLICFNLNGAVYSFFDIEELKSINYGIDIRNDPVVMKSDDESSDLNSVQLTSKYGQLYQCNFPNTAEKEKEKEEAEKVAVETGIPDLLKPMESGPCLRMNNGWWSYEFCYGRSIRQFHLNEESKIEGEVLSLGIYESEFDWEEDAGQSDFEKKQNRLRRYHTQQYVNGTQCDLNGQLRRTEVRFICEDGSGDYINRVDEPETCSYIMTVHTTKICHHPFLKPPTPTKTVSITCHPLLTVIQYQEYLDEIEGEEERKRLEEEKQKEKEENLQRIAREKEKYFKKSQDMPDETSDTETADEEVDTSDDTNFFKDMINAAKQLKPGETPVEVNTVYQVINDPSDVDEFIKKAVKEMERVGKEARKKKDELEADVNTAEEETLTEEEESEADDAEMDIDNMQRFDGTDDNDDGISQEHLQTVDSVNKMKSGHRQKPSRKHRDSLKRVQRGIEEEDEDVEEEEEMDEKKTKGEIEDEEEADNVLDKKGKRQNLFQDVEKHLQKLAEKQKQYRDRTMKDDTKGEFRDSSDLSEFMDKVSEQLKDMMDAQEEMTEIGKDINQLLGKDEEEDEEIKTIKSKYQDKRTKLVDIKQKLKNLMEKQYESIVKEAEEELGLEDEEVDRPTATQELAKTLDGLLAKMDKTEQEINAVDKELEQFAEFDNEEKDTKSVPPVRDDLQQSKDPFERGDDDRVQVRVSRIKPGQKFSSSSDKQTQELEKSVKEELAKAGFANGDKIQVKIITSYYDGDDDSVHTLSEKDSETFKNLIVNLIGGTSEGDKETARHQEQEDNYSFVFGKRKEATRQLYTDTQTDAQTDIQMEEDGS